VILIALKQPNDLNELSICYSNLKMAIQYCETVNYQNCIESLPSKILPKGDILYF